MKQQKYDTIIDRILDVMSAVGMFMIAFLMLGICVHVIMRYVFGQPQNWVIDVSSILLFYITFLGAAWVLRAERHVALDFIIHHLKPHRQCLLQIVNSLFCSAVCAVISVYGIIETITVWHYDLSLDMALEPPKWIVVVFIPLGSSMLFVQFIRRTRGFVKKLRSYKGDTSAV